MNPYFAVSGELIAALLLVLLALLLGLLHRRWPSRELVPWFI